MSIVGYGLGVDVDTADFVVAYGFGISQLQLLQQPWVPIRFQNQITAEIRSVSVAGQPCQ
jgi:hypothetical protein